MIGIEIPPLNKSSAAKLGLKFFIGTICKYGHVPIRRVSNGDCVECSKKYRSDNRDKMGVYNAEYYTLNSSKIKANSKNYKHDKSLDRRAAREQLINTNVEQANTLGVELMDLETARSMNLRKFFSKTTCKNNHFPTERLTSTRQCTRCLSERTKRIKNADPEGFRGKRREYANSPESKAYMMEYRKKWNRENRAYKTAHTAQYRLSKEQRTPAWADLSKILEFYKESRRLTLETGIIHHVDHIIPLHGKNVSGLHVETNLQVITATQNISKFNKYPTD